MKNVEINSFNAQDDLARNCSEAWLDEIAGVHSSKLSLYLVALSGGRITKLFFAEIVQRIQHGAERFQDLFVNRKVHFFWADERCVPPNDPESNYGIARQLLFEPLKVPESQIHRLRGEGPEEPALKEADEAVRSLMPDAKAKAAPKFDMIFLGMGEDGHVASLFPGESEDVMANPAIYRAVTAVKPPPRRFTLGYATIADASQVWVLASGAGKEAALQESLAADGRTPLARVLRLRAKLPPDRTRIYTDISPTGGLAPRAKKA